MPWKWRVVDETRRWRTIQSNTNTLQKGNWELFMKQVQKPHTSLHCMQLLLVTLGDVGTTQNCVVQSYLYHGLQILCWTDICNPRYWHNTVLLHLLLNTESPDCKTGKDPCNLLIYQQVWLVGHSCLAEPFKDSIVCLCVSSHQCSIQILRIGKERVTWDTSRFSNWLESVDFSVGCVTWHITELCTLLSVGRTF